MKKISPYLYLFFLLLTLTCNQGNFTLSKEATLVLGQANFNGNNINRNASTDSNSLALSQRIFFDGTHLFLTDTGNHRVLIYNSEPTANGQSADVVIGQATMTDNSPNQGGGPGATTLNTPTGIFSNGTILFIADSGNNRVLVFNTIPSANNPSADRVVGQSNFTNTQSNQGITPDSHTLSFPQGVYYDGFYLYVADTGNNRVLIYDSIDTNNTSATTVIGQSSFSASGANRGGSPAANTLSSPTAVYTNGTSNLVIADSNNNRILIYNSNAPANGANADTVIGQTDMLTNATNQGGTTSSTSLSSPIDISSDGVSLAVSDSANHRVLIYNTIPTANGIAANDVLGQADFTSSSANQGKTIAADTLNNPRGVFLDDIRIWITDTNNHRALRFSR